MLKLRLIIAFLLLCSTAQSQVDHRFIDPLSSWSMESTVTGSDIDIVVSEYWMTSFNPPIFENDSVSIATFNNWDSGIYIEDKLLHRVSWTDSIDTLTLFDYSWKKGDIIVQQTGRNMPAYNGFCWSEKYSHMVFDILDTGYFFVLDEPRRSLDFDIYCVDSAGNADPIYSEYIYPFSNFKWVDGMGGAVMPNFLTWADFPSWNTWLLCYNYGGLNGYYLPGTPTHRCFPTGANESLEIGGLAVFPNPFTEELTIEYSDDILGLIIYNALGRMVYSELSPNMQLNLGFLSPGMYILSIETDRGTVRERIVKE